MLRTAFGTPSGTGLARLDVGVLGKGKIDRKNMLIFAPKPIYGLASKSLLLHSSPPVGVPFSVSFKLLHCFPPNFISQPPGKTGSVPCVCICRIKLVMLLLLPVLSRA